MGSPGKKLVDRGREKVTKEASLLGGKKSGRKRSEYIPSTYNWEFFGSKQASEGPLRNFLCPGGGKNHIERTTVCNSEQLNW